MKNPIVNDDSWRIWNKTREMRHYGEALYARATGAAPEMESSKAVAKSLDGVLQPGNRVLDVGCNAGHYLVSLRNRFNFPFEYVGVDATAYYIELARKAFADDANASFQVGDIYNLPFEPESFDIVISCNLFHHLPNIVTPTQQLWRVTKRLLLIRTLVGHSSFRIKEVREPEESSQGQESIFDEAGEPSLYNYFNIYSEKYISYLCSTLTRVASYQIVPDSEYDSAALGLDKWSSQVKPKFTTEAIAGLQVYGYIVQPWAFVKAWRTAP